MLAKMEKEKLRCNVKNLRRYVMSKPDHINKQAQVA